MMRKHPLAKCEECPLANKKIAPTSGPENAKYALVSRSPGRHDVSEGYPFAGPSGRVVDYLLKQNGVKREDIITTNVVLCETDDPPKEAIQACKPRLDSEVAGCETIIAAGAEAVKIFTGKTIDNARGFANERNGKRIIATNNPALVLRDADSFPNLVKDFKRAINPLPRPVLPKVTIIRDITQAQKFLKDLVDNPPPLLAADIEARGGTSHRAELACIGLSASGERSVVLGIEPLSDSKVYSLLRSLLEDSPTRFVWHFGKYDVKALRFNEIKARIDHDSYALSIACDERPGVHSLEYMLMDEFGWPDYEPESVKKFKTTGQINDLNELYEYNGWDVAGTMQLFTMLQRRAKDDNVYHSWILSFVVSTTM
jgi:uracil-DNA glycosylase family 4